MAATVPFTGVADRVLAANGSASGGPSPAPFPPSSAVVVGPSVDVVGSGRVEVVVELGGGSVVVVVVVVVGVVVVDEVVVVVDDVGGMVRVVCGTVGGGAVVVGRVDVGRGLVVDVSATLDVVGSPSVAAATSDVAGSEDSTGSELGGADDSGIDDSTVDSGHSSGIELSGGALVADAAAVPTDTRATATPQLSTAMATVGVTCRPERRSSTKIAMPDASATMPSARIGPTDPPEIGRSQ